MGSGLWGVGRGRLWGVDGGEWTVDCGEWTVGSRAIEVSRDA